jgi:molecular chaperone GrpE (heat shock protein)
VQAVVQQTTSALSKLEEDNQQHGEKIQDIMNAFLALNPKLDEKDKEINRYKEGHDSKLISKYILSYIKVRDQIIKMTDSDQFVLKNLEQLIERLNMEIEHADVKEIEVSIGDKFLDEKYGGKLATPKLVPTDDTEKNGTIVSVDLAGYEFTGNERNIILRPAKVSVYELQEIK